MKKTFVLLAVCLLFPATFALSQEKKTQAPAMDEKAAMEMMTKLATPGGGHRKLDVLAGSWQTKNTMWMAPGAPPSVSEGTSEHKWVLGGRFLEQRYRGTFMNMPFEGLGFTGYDNYKKQYVATWMDTFGTMMLNTTGTFDGTGKVLTSTGKMDDFTTGKISTFRERVTFVSKDEVVMEMFGPDPAGKDFRMMEIRYTRK